MQAKLPNFPPSIFALMSGLAHKHRAVNLSQGFPDFDCAPQLKVRLQHYVEAGYNQYAPLAGVAELNQQIAAKIERLYNQSYNPQEEITMTAGATQALYGAIAAFVRPEDEVILLEPAYDLYRPVIEMQGALVRSYQMKAPDWKVAWQAVEDLISSKTRMLIINSPHNPTGSLLQEEDLKALAGILDRWPQLLLLSDEVYEHLVLDGQQHHSVLKYPAMRRQTMAAFSFGKTLHATGWKLGYLVADAPLMHEFRKLHQFNVFCVNTPMQYAIADYLAESREYEQLSGLFQRKRDHFLEGLAQTKFEFNPTQGTYFQIASYRHISDANDLAFAKYLTEEKGLATIPVSPFYANGQDDKLLRFCFAKEDSTLDAALDILQSL